MKNPNFKPISNKLIVKKLEKDALTPGGIVIPDNVRDSYDKMEAAMGEVLAVGPGLDEHRHLPGGGMDCMVGDIVLYMSNQGLEFKLEGKPYLSIAEKFVLGKFSV